MTMMTTKYKTCSKAENQSSSAFSMTRFKRDVVSCQKRPNIASKETCESGFITLLADMLEGLHGAAGLLDHFQH